MDLYKNTIYPALVNLLASPKPIQASLACQASEEFFGLPTVALGLSDSLRLT